MIAGIDWVAGQTSRRPAVANLIAYSLAEGMPANAAARTMAVSATGGKGVKSGKNWAVTVTIKQHDGSTFMRIPRDAGHDSMLMPDT